MDPERVGVPVGDRWRPGTDSALFHGKDEGFTWGMIASRRLQHTLREQGMRFYGEPPEPTTDLVGYTHGMIRAIYECARIGEGTPYEMSIGGATAKLASCAACTTFMVANGYEPSSTHLGRGESWVPLYHAYGHNNSYKPDQTPILTAIQQCNETWARHVEDWVQRGVRAMQGQLGWVHEEHRPALEQLAARVAHPADGLACANLFLDALTVHDSDAKRIDRALVYGDAPRAHCHEGYDWARNTPEGPYIWEVFENPFTDETIRGFQALDQT